MAFLPSYDNPRSPMLPEELDRMVRYDVLHGWNTIAEVLQDRVETGVRYAMGDQSDVTRMQARYVVVFGHLLQLLLIIPMEVLKVIEASVYEEIADSSDWAHAVETVRSQIYQSTGRRLSAVEILHEPNLYRAAIAHMVCDALSWETEGEGVQYFVSVPVLLTPSSIIFEGALHGAPVRPGAQQSWDELKDLPFLPCPPETTPT